MQVSIFGWAGVLVSAWRAGFGWPQLSLVAALAAAQSNFLARFYPRALPSFLAYLIMQHSSSHPEPLHEPSTLARMAGLDLNAPLEEEADAPASVTASLELSRLRCRLCRGWSRSEHRAQVRTPAAKSPSTSPPRAPTPTRWRGSSA